ncbi:P-loop containing nucleoside triphosphate hydrolase protein [Limtongia smithiae]|uniref:P-loop containing nucleoside triphosphate hydrolase protein n=1 Tax=Limtongia smithiae TaxID=1125753 RepID=UPI0034CD2634
MAGKSVNLNNAKPSSSASSSNAKTTASSTNGVAKEAVPLTTEYIVRPTIPTPGLRITAHPSILRTHGVAQGDLLSVCKSTPCSSSLTSSIARVATAPVYADASVGTDALQLSRGLRGLAGVLLGDRVRVERVKMQVPDAGEVAVSFSVDGEEEDKLGAATIIAVLREIKYISPGQLISTPRLHIQIHTIRPSHASPTPSPLYAVTAATPKLRILPSHPPPLSPAIVPGARYSMLGGLDSEIALIRRTITQPLLRPEIFARFNVAPPRGVLLHGPPGTGKTMLLRAIAHETPQAHVLTISASAVLGRYLGDTEASIRRVFDEAKRFAPSVILMDEIDALAPRRDGDAAGETETRIVATLLTLFDELGEDTAPSDGVTEADNAPAPPRVVVVAATNRIASVDSALRRPGRFDREIELRIPDINARLAILQRHLCHTPHSLTPAQVSSIASKTHGFVGADIAALSREAVMCAVARGDDTGVELSEVVVEFADFTTAMGTVRASAMREIFLETPKVLWEDIGGQDDVKRKLREMVEWPLTHPATFIRLGIAPPRGILLYGPPGCSKTLTAKALATEAGLNFLAVKGPEIFNKYVGESERAVREIFRKARNAAPSIIFFDEIDAIATARGHAETGGDRVLTSLLNEMDGVESAGAVVVLAATNRPEVLDPALLRPGRIDRLVYVSPPDAQSRKSIFEITFRGMSVAEDVDVANLVIATEGCSGADIAALCQEAGLHAMNEDLDAPCIAARHFDAAVKGMKRSITPEMVQFYADFQAGARG